MGSLPWHASDAQVAFWQNQVMDKLERFKELSDSMPTVQKVELYQQFVASPEAGIERIIELAAAEGLQLDKAEVSALIKAIDVEDGLMTLSWMLLLWLRWQVVMREDVGADCHCMTNNGDVVLACMIECSAGMSGVVFNK